MADDPKPRFKRESLIEYAKRKAEKDKDDEFPAVIVNPVLQKDKDGEDQVPKMKMKRVSGEGKDAGIDI